MTVSRDSSSAILSTHRLCKHWGEGRGVHDLSFELRAGEVVGLVGRNGAGKSTAMRMLAGTLPPTSGSIEWTRTDRQRSSRVGYLPEQCPLYDELTIQETLSFALELHRYPRASAPSRIQELMERTDLTDRADQMVGHLSKGLRKRVGIAQAIAHDPDLIILDEPMSGLDPVQIRELRTTIMDVAKAHTVLISSHILGELESLCDRHLVLDDGHLAMEVGRLEQDHVDLVVAAPDSRPDALQELIEPLVPEVIQTRAYEGPLEAVPRDGLWRVTVRSPASGTPSLLRSLLDRGVEVHYLSPTLARLEELLTQERRSDGDRHAA